MKILERLGAINTVFKIKIRLITVIERIEATLRYRSKSVIIKAINDVSSPKVIRFSRTEIAPKYTTKLIETKKINVFREIEKLLIVICLKVIDLTT